MEVDTGRVKSSESQPPEQPTWSLLLPVLSVMEGH